MNWCTHLYLSYKRCQLTELEVAQATNHVAEKLFNLLDCEFRLLGTTLMRRVKNIQDDSQQLEAFPFYELFTASLSGINNILVQHYLVNHQGREAPAVSPSFEMLTHRIVNFCSPNTTDEHAKRLYSLLGHITQLLSPTMLFHMKESWVDYMVEVQKYNRRFARRICREFPIVWIIPILHSIWFRILTLKTGQSETD